MSTAEDSNRRTGASGSAPDLEIRAGLEREYADIFTPEARAALAALARFDPERKALMEVRIRGYHLSLRRREADAIWVGAPREAGSEECDRGGIDTPGAAPRGAGRKSQ